MKAELIAVGTELLMGQIANTNAQFLSEQLADIGVDVFFHTVVGDNPLRLKQAVEIGFSRANILIFTGGLGPTQDDLTKETVAEYFGLPLLPDEESIENLHNYFKTCMPQNNLKQGYFPKDAIILKNSKGTAPGCIIESNEKIAILMPGPPFEMKPMFTESVRPYLIERSGETIVSKMMRVFGVGESKLEEDLKDLFDTQTNPTIAMYARQGEVGLRISAKTKTHDEGEALVEKLSTEVAKRLGRKFYAVGENATLCETAINMLMKHGFTIATAESCTGGLIAKQITDIKGASKVFNQGFITYSNEAKTKSLGVPKEILDSHGAVSEETAFAMAEGLKNVTNADICVSVTGIAGPDGGSAEKPVGLVYIGFATKDNVFVKKLNLNGDRDKIRNVTALNVFNIVREILLDEEDKK